MGKKAKPPVGDAAIGDRGTLPGVETFPLASLGQDAARQRDGTKKTRKQSLMPGGQSGKVKGC